MDPLANHLSLANQSNIHIIVLMETIYMIYLLIAEIITIMILCIVAIQCENDYIMQIFMDIFCEIYYIMHAFWYVSTDDACIYAFLLCLVC